jgi:hypothetical protein
MAVMKNDFSGWPDTVAFKRMIRTLIRAQQYVPPQQPEGEAPPPGPTVLSVQAAPETPALVPMSRSEWRLGQNAVGDLVARHVSGHEQIIAANPEGAANG